MALDPGRRCAGKWIPGLRRHLKPELSESVFNLFLQDTAVGDTLASFKF